MTAPQYPFDSFVTDADADLVSSRIKPHPSVPITVEGPYTGRDWFDVLRDRVVYASVAASFAAVAVWKWWPR